MTHGLSDARSDDVELAGLRGRVAMVQAKLLAVRAAHDQLAGEVERLRVDNQRLRARVGELAAQVEELRRACRRQAAPFSTGTTAPHPRQPGRKAGIAYGHHARRPVPDRIDRVVDVRLPAACPHCSGALTVERVACQYQEDLPHPERPRSAATTSRLAAASGAGGVSSHVTPSRPRKRWARPASRSGHARLRWRCGRPRGWACRLARSPDCSASSASRSPLVG